MKKILLTGFDPFGEEKINPSYEVISEFKKLDLPDIEITIIRLPVVFGEAIDLITSSIEKIKPTLILSLGQAGGSMGVRIERIGININSSSAADNKGNKLEDEFIIENGPAAYFATIAIRKTLLKLQENGIPATISNSAGTYVCNNVMYGTLHYLATTKEFNNTKYGFIHIPFLPKQVAEKKKLFPSMSIEKMLQAIEIIIKENTK